MTIAETEEFCIAFFVLHLYVVYMHGHVFFACMHVCVGVHSWYVEARGSAARLPQTLSGLRKSTEEWSLSPGTALHVC